MSNNDNKIIKDSIIALKNVKEKIPLTNCITNYVTINDCANAVLAIGGSPMMADDPEEIEDFVEIADTLVINIGKMSKSQIEAMLLGADYGTKTNTPIVLDPVGVGVTNLRNKIVLKLIKESNISAVRGNMSEIKTIAQLIDLDEVKSLNKSLSKGVDVSEGDETTKENLKSNAKIIKALAKEIDTVIIASGAIDIISDGKTVFACENGDSLMPKITGSGCMLSSIVGTFCGANDPFIGGIAATIAMGVAGEEAGKIVREEKTGTGTFRSKLIDYLYNMDEKLLLKETKLYEIKLIN
ncbi:hydroxyethylthiazole kinase [Methanobrevibacter sp. TMH8]|uniref:hydroxyethylthiazole kinase n=1 Tax=Methanobrevibacter sp. TMH8 TaxID=2848611 RepID=UPI001CCD8973|nr:hydroxyethylthiazole kinase [Methanobrevibacter sp. TMH8]MBZ9570026.1 hydroxyethylthiazole kinase [Methanobrevibacter sp. TMH8]